MTTAHTTAPATGTSPLDGIRLTVPGLLRSEWIKLRSLRSTLWCLGLVIVLSVGFAALLSGVAHLQNPGALSSDDANHLLVEASTIGVGFTQLVAAVLGVLVISGEYSTGMIRSTFTADPGRLGAFFAKLVVLAVTVFVVSLVSIAVSALVAQSILTGRGVHSTLGDSKVLLSLLGAAGYLALIAMLAFAVGALVRSSAGGIATILGTLLVLPVALSIIIGLTTATWLSNLEAFLPSEAGGVMYKYVSANPPPVASGIVSLDAWQGGLVLLAWVVVVTAAAAALIKRRDV